MVGLICDPPPDSDRNNISESLGATATNIWPSNEIRLKRKKSYRSTIFFVISWGFYKIDPNANL